MRTPRRARSAATAASGSLRPGRAAFQEVLVDLLGTDVVTLWGQEAAVTQVRVGSSVGLEEMPLELGVFGGIWRHHSHRGGSCDRFDSAVGEVPLRLHPRVSVLGEDVKVGPSALVLAPGPTDVHASMEAVAAFPTGNIGCVHLSVVLGHLPKSCLCAPEPFIVHTERLRKHGQLVPDARRGGQRRP